MKKTVLEYMGILLGALFIAVGLYFFWMPSDLAAGGVSGLSIVVKSVLPAIPIGIILLVLDIFMFAIGFLMLGKSFGVRSIVCSLAISIITTILEFIFPGFVAITDDTLVILIFGAILIAIGQAIVFNLEASSGGTDIIAKIITKYFPLNIGVALMIADLCVVLLATTVFGLEKGLYAALGVFVTSALIDYIIAGINVVNYVMVIPSSEELGKEINHYILNELDRGATIYHAEGGYSGEAKMVITTVLERKEFVHFKRYMMERDPLAFVTVQNLHEVEGEGFKK